MCSIEEAWAGQTFDGYRVQSQADLRRKYMSIGNDMLGSNNEFTPTTKEPAPRVGNNGINTKMIRPLQVPATHSNSNMPNDFNVSFEDNQMPVDNYGGLEPRPKYMSIYDNAESQNEPMPTQTQAQAGKSPFGNINQAFQVSPIVERFMCRGANDSNQLQNENNNDDRIILTKKFNSADTNNNNNQAANHQVANHQAANHQAILTSLQDILSRLERLEREMHNGQSRNMYDMVLYILVGILLAFIVYSVLHK